jgi:hypothetical protein
MRCPNIRRMTQYRSREWAEIGELRQEVRELRRANDRRGARGPASGGGSTFGSRRRSLSAARSRLAHRRFVAVLGAGVIVIAVAATVNGLSGASDSRPVPNSGSLAGLSTRERIVAIANSQVGYRTDPQRSYCNKFSAYWNAGTAECSSGETSEEWCADFAAWVWQKAGVQLSYGYNPGQINARASSFYAWGVANGRWHPISSGYVAAPGDVAVYGLVLGADPLAAHVAIVTDTPRRQRGPDVVNGDGDRTGFSVVETGTDQARADAGHNHDSTLAGYVSPL